jgi:serine/threonine-protein kinase
MTYANLRNWAEAIRFSEMGINIAPDEPQGYSIRGFIILAQEGNVEKTRKFIRDNIDQIDSSQFVFERGWTELLGRNYQGAVKIFEEDEGENLLGIALAYRLMGQETTAEQYYDSARIRYEQYIKNFPDDGNPYTKLGISYAGLGRKADAIRTANRGIELIPVSKDALTGSSLLEELAIIYTMTGEHDLAIDRIEDLLSMPGMLTIQLLKLRPVFDPLRDHPRFQELIEKYSD